MFLFYLEKDSLEDEFLFIKILGLKMIKLVYLEFRLGLEFSRPCVKVMMLRTWILKARTEVKSICSAIISKVEFETKILIKK